MEDQELNLKILGLARLAYDSAKDPNDSAFGQGMRAIASDLGRYTPDQNASDAVRDAATAAATQVGNELTKALGMAIGLFGHFAAAVEHASTNVNVPEYLQGMADRFQ